MITIGGEIIVYPPGGLNSQEIQIFGKKQSQARVYNYRSLNELLFELRTRRLLTEAAVALNGSGVQFASFRDSRCNPRYWHRDARGGFQLLSAVTPAQGIRNIFNEGYLYAFECATAMVIVLYKGMLDSLGERLFNLWFGGLLLYDWHYDQDLHLVDSWNAAKAVPGDIQYFQNPDVAPEFSDWRGENVVTLDDDLYYGHGIGIKSGQQIIDTLNTKRRRGSRNSAYLDNIVVHPDYSLLYRTIVGESHSLPQPYN